MLLTVGFTSRVRMCPTPRRGITKIRAFAAFQCLRSWSAAVTAFCLNFKMTIWNDTKWCFAVSNSYFQFLNDFIEIASANPDEENWVLEQIRIGSSVLPIWPRWGKGCWRPILWASAPGKHQGGVSVWKSDNFEENLHHPHIHLLVLYKQANKSLLSILPFWEAWTVIVLFQISSQFFTSKIRLSIVWVSS